MTFAQKTRLIKPGDFVFTHLSPYPIRVHTCEKARNGLWEYSGFDLGGEAHTFCENVVGSRATRTRLERVLPGKCEVCGVIGDWQAGFRMNNGSHLAWRTMSLCEDHLRGVQ